MSKGIAQASDQVRTDGRVSDGYLSRYEVAVDGWGYSRRARYRDTVGPRLNTEPERCKLVVDGLLHDIRTAVGVHLDDVALAGYALAGYADDHFNNWGVMTTACVRIAKRRGLDPKEQKDCSPFQRTSKYVQGTSGSESEGERMAFARGATEGGVSRQR